MTAAEMGRLEIVRLLLDSGADVDATDDTSSTPLTSAVWYGHTEVAALLLDRRAQASRWDPYGSPDDETLLALAAQRGTLSMVRLLIDRGADLHEAGSDGLTPLAWAIQAGHPRVADYLRERGAER